MPSATPQFLYKYKSFSVDSLDLLISDKLFFADPTSFNDPLDCNPSVKDNINNVNLLEDILRKLCIDSQRKELEIAAAKIKYKGVRTLEKIDSLGEQAAQSLLGRISEYVDMFGDSHIDSLVHHIKNLLLTNYTNGILSLAKNNNCPLMWSHYADQHKGFCIGYDVSVNQFDNIFPLNYGGKRFITTEQIHDMLFNSNDDIKAAAKKEIDDVVLLSKASSWNYENEYRVISHQGLQNSPFKLIDVTFGLRFKHSAKYSVMRALSIRENMLAARQNDIKFYEMTICDESFVMNRKQIDLEHPDFASLPADHYATYQEFPYLF